jgi:hypothetical protein
MKTEPMRVLDECAETMAKKGRDYQNPSSIVRQADYYPNGCMTILDIIHAKTLRMRSVLEAMTNDPTYEPNFESLEDSAKDLINYAAFFVSYSRGKIDGQDPSRDMLNRQKAEAKPVDSLVDLSRYSGVVTAADASGRFGLPMNAAVVDERYTLESQEPPENWGSYRMNSHGAWVWEQDR